MKIRIIKAGVYSAFIMFYLPKKCIEYSVTKLLNVCYISMNTIDLSKKSNKIEIDKKEVNYESDKWDRKRK